MLATPQDACREFARNAGQERPDQAWILTHFDTWERNPFYSGPAVRHPEDDDHPEADAPESEIVVSSIDDMPF